MKGMMREMEVIGREARLKKGEYIISDKGEKYKLLESATIKESNGLQIYRIRQVLSVGKGRTYFLKCAYSDNPKGVGNLERENNFRLYYAYIEHVVKGFHAKDCRGDSMYCVAFEYIDGWNLREYWEYEERLVQEGKLGWKEFRKRIFRQMTQLLNGVNYYVKFACSDPYLHRDLKPENIMITRERNVVIVDFDIAHVSGSKDTQMCMTGGGGQRECSNKKRRKGKPRKERMLGMSGGYTAPELCISIWNGEPKMPNVKSDIYSIGRIFFFWMQGRDYFTEYECGDWESLCNFEQDFVYGFDQARFHKTKLYSEIDTELLRIIRKMCVKPEERYEDIAEIMRDMRTFLIQYCGNSEEKYEQYIGKNQMPLLQESTRYKLETAPNVICEIYVKEEKSKRGKPLLNHTMRDILIEDKLVMIIYNLDGIISYIPYGKNLSRIREGNDYEIHPGEEFMFGDIRIKFCIY